MKLGQKMRARIVIYNENINSILLIHRIKNKRDYWVIPGGGAQNSETPCQTAIREINEELQMKFKVNDISYIFDINEKERQKIYFAKTDSIYTPNISGEEAMRSSNNNIYIPTWINITILDKINLQPKEALKKIENFCLELTN